MTQPRDTKRSEKGRPEAAVAGPVRACAGCNADDAVSALVRVVLAEPPAGGAATVVVDAKGGSFGRGAHVHPAPKCIDAACKRGFARAFKREIHADAGALSTAIAEAYAKRLEGLLAGGLRGGHVVFGSDEVAEAWAQGRVALVLLAADATAAANAAAVRKATGEGKVLVFGDKLRLARALGRKPGEEREGIGVCAATDAGLAAAIRQAWLCAVGLARNGERPAAETPGSPVDDPRTSSEDNGAAGGARGAEA